MTYTSREGIEIIRLFFAKHIDYQPDENPLCFIDWKHFCADYSWILTHGLSGTVENIRVLKQRYSGNSDKMDLLNAMEDVCFQIKAYAEKVADGYENMGHGDIAENLRTVPFFPAISFTQAVQSIWFIWLFMPDSLGS